MEPMRQLPTANERTLPRMKRMNRIKPLLRRAFFACLVFVGWLAVSGVALAAPPEPPKQEVGSGVYVMLYFLVIFGIAIGMLCVCRPCNRRDRAKIEQFADKLESEK